MHCQDNSVAFSHTEHLLTNHATGNRLANVLYNFPAVDAGHAFPSVVDVLGSAVIESLSGLPQIHIPNRHTTWDVEPNSGQ